MAAAAAMISVTGLEKTFEQRHGGIVRAVDGVSFEVGRGETVGLVGESGCGKSTVGRCVLRLLKPDSGVVAFDGTEIQALALRRLRPFRRKLQMVFQDPLGSLNPAFSVRATLRDALRQVGLSGGEREERIGELLLSVGLDSRFLERRPSQMSGGQLQRVGIARALASDPDFIFLDEPTSSLDLSVRGQIINLLGDLQAERRLGYLFASHDLGVVRFLADRVFVMYQGRIMESGPTAGLFDEPQHPYTEELLAGASFRSTQGSPGRRQPPRRAAAPLDDVPKAQGCLFADRCPYVHDRCLASEPPLIRTGTDRGSRCWLSEPRVPARAPSLNPGPG